VEYRIIGRHGVLPAPNLTDDELRLMLPGARDAMILILGVKGDLMHGGVERVSVFA